MSKLLESLVADSSFVQPQRVSGLCMQGIYFAIALLGDVFARLL